MSDIRSFDHLVFDLDDTLLDTYRQLLPNASREACTAMLDAGMKGTLEACLKVWDEFRNSQSREEIFAHLLKHFGVREGADAAAVAQRGFHSFYNRRVETNICLIPGVRELLVKLYGSYVLHLVTSGSRVTQEEKIRILGISAYFKSIGHVDPSRGERKKTSFARIMEETHCPPARHLSIGNRVDTDIADARAIGWKTCWVRYGEHAGLLPSSDIEKPEFTVDNVVDVIEKCRL